MNDLYVLKNVTVKHGGAFSLENISLNIQRAKITAIIGPNGSGKTSLLNIITFISNPYAGAVSYGGIPVHNNRVDGFKKNIGYVQQNPYLLRGTVRKNIELGLRLRHINNGEIVKRCDSVMELLNIKALSERKSGSLSGGEAQKVAMGRILVLEPDVLVLDEPFTHLDKQSVSELEGLITKLKNDFHKTIVITTHSQHQARKLADTVYSVIDGKLSEFESEKP